MNAPLPTTQNLIERFPLVAIRTAAEYDRAIAVVEFLFGRDDLDEDQERYNDALVELVTAYEDREYPFDDVPISPLDALKHLMEANDMGVGDLGKVIGSQPVASLILSGKRPISKANAKKLGQRFCVDAGLFLFSTPRPFSASRKTS